MLYNTHTLQVQIQVNTTVRYVNNIKTLGVWVDFEETIDDIASNHLQFKLHQTIMGYTLSANANTLDVVNVDSGYYTIGTYKTIDLYKRYGKSLMSLQDNSKFAYGVRSNPSEHMYVDVETFLKNSICVKSLDFILIDSLKRYRKHFVELANSVIQSKVPSFEHFIIVSIDFLLTLNQYPDKSANGAFNEMLEHIYEETVANN